jgi:hypothetical protein
MAAWNVEGVDDQQLVQICYGDFCMQMPHAQANKVAHRILSLTGAGGATSASRTAGPSRSNRDCKTSRRTVAKRLMQ